jgi:hypothetical protein
MTFPYPINKNGIGAHAKIIKAGKVVAQLLPKFTNIKAPKKGKARPKNERRMALAAKTEVANGL